MFIDGVMSKIGTLRDTISEVAGEIGDFIGFQSPTKKGPGAKADQWMPNLIDMIANGLSNGVGQVGRSAALIGGALSGGLTPAYTGVTS